MLSSTSTTDKSHSVGCTKVSVYFPTGIKQKNKRAIAGPNGVAHIPHAIKYSVSSQRSEARATDIDSNVTQYNSSTVETRTHTCRKLSWNGSSITRPSTLEEVHRQVSTTPSINRELLLVLRRNRMPLRDDGPLQRCRRL